MDTQDLAVADGALFQDAHIADLDGDGSRDIVMSGGAGGLATIFWRRGNGDRTYAETRTFTSGASGLYDEFDLADLPADGDLDIACRESGAMGLHTVILAYNPLTGSFDQSATILPGGVPEFARLDADSLWDLCLSEVDLGWNGAAYRGRAGYAFDPVQDLPGVVTSASTRFFGSPRPDLLSGGRGQVAVWRNLIGAADIDAGPDVPPRAGGYALRISPTVASSMTTVDASGAWRDPLNVEVIDASGRVLEMRPGNTIPWNWNLRGGDGSPLPSGVYWIRITDMAGRRGTGRLQIIR